MLSPTADSWVLDQDPLSAVRPTPWNTYQLYHIRLNRHTNTLKKKLIDTSNVMVDFFFSFHTLIRYPLFRQIWYHFTVVHEQCINNIPFLTLLSTLHAHMLYNTVL